jgi:hypothetical protein
MPDKLLKHGLTDSDKIGGLSVFAELLFVRLILATCYAGRCPWSTDWIRTHALPNRPRTRLTEIATALETLRMASLVIRYHGPDGTAYLLIPNHGQRLKRAVRSPWPAPAEGPPDVEGQTFMALPSVAPPEALAAAPPVRPRAKPVVSSVTHFTSLPSSLPWNGEASSRDKPRPHSSAERGFSESDTRPADDCLDEVARLFPRHDVRACLRSARAYVRRQRGEDSEVTVGWFVVHWMPKAAQRKERDMPLPGETAAERAAREADAARFEEASKARIAAIVAGPEPEHGTLDHAIWLEGRKSA